MQTLDDYLSSAKWATTPEAQRKRAVFERFYGVAMQLGELREKHAMTQAELAEKTGIAQSEISRIERGVINPRTDTLLRLADALGAEVRLVERAPATKG